MSVRLRLAKRLNPLSRPTMVSLPDLRIMDTFAATVRFSSLEYPVLDSVPPIEPTEVEEISDIVEAVLSLTEIETLFEPLTRPRIDGKRYSELDEVLEDDDKRQTTFNFDMTLQCRHGLIQDLCQVCRNERATNRRKNREKEPVTVDVFEQLRYILQPPIIGPKGQPIVLPNGLEPYKFQVAGAQWLIGRTEALLADEMGLGKTIQAIYAMRILFRAGHLQRALVVCPASLTITWERELKSWAPDLRHLRIHGSKDVRAETWKEIGRAHV